MDIDGFGTFSAHLARLALMSKEVSHHVTAEGVKAIRKDAQERIGSYQDGGDGFPAWANLAPATVIDRLNKGFTPDDPLLRTGSLRDSIEAHAIGDDGVVGSKSDIARYQEEGTSTIPPRPFLGPAAFNSNHTVGPMAARTLIAWVCGVGFKKPNINLEHL